MFSCGNDALDRYLREQASQDVKKRVATIFVLTEASGNTVIGYYTLAAGNVDLGEWPEALKKKLPLYPVVPVTLLGRLAVDKKHHGRKLGEYLLMDALWRCSTVAKEIASLAVIVDAIDDKARRFYEHYGFRVFPKQSDRLFLHMQTIHEMF
ncbi:GNAT family N-acetyltransferase [bacterium]|nr:MAG: GNAT family N-acetyltransferase [bacterium]